MKVNIEGKAAPTAKIIEVLAEVEKQIENIKMFIKLKD